MKDRRANKDKVTPLPSQEELNRVLAYDPETGILTWKERPRADFKTDRSHKVWNIRYAGTAALHSVGKKGYRVGHLFGQMVKASRVIWKMVKGYDPELVDHGNGDKTDNRFENLSDVTDPENGKNRKLYSTNKSGIPGVYWNRAGGKWQVQIGSGPGKHVGFFDTLEEAREARAKAQELRGYHPNHGRESVS
jgi:hypothetical protein